MRQVNSEPNEQGQIVVAFAALLTVLVLFRDWLSTLDFST